MVPTASAAGHGGIRLTFQAGSSAGPRGRSGLGGLLRAQSGAHRPTLALPLPHPGAGPARRAARGRAAEGAEAARARARVWGAPPPQAQTGRAACQGAGGVAGAAWPRAWVPGREAVRLPPPAPAAGCDRPGEPAAAFCSAGPARTAAARPGRAGPPRPAGALAAVIPRPQPGSLGAPPTTLSMAASRVPPARSPRSAASRRGRGDPRSGGGLGHLGGGGLLRAREG